MKRIAGHKGVEAVLVYTNSEEIPVRSQPVMEHMDMVHYVGQIAPLIKQVKAMVKSFDTSNDFTSLRLRTKKNEILVSPEKEYTMVVVQKAGV